jgi:hypothetical protein
LSPSPTPAPPIRTHKRKASSLRKKEKKGERPTPYQRALAMKQTYHPSDPECLIRFQTRRFLQKLQQDHGELDIFVVQQAVKQGLDELWIEENHNILGCRDCFWEGSNIYYCRKSIHNARHPYHRCPAYQKCTC